MNPQYLIKSDTADKMKINKRPTMMLIMDGFGINKNTKGNAIAMANTPNLDALFSEYPMTTVHASGLDVGLPQGQMGNSEVGHLNIGAGRIVYQDLTLITKAIDDGSFCNNTALVKAMDHVASNGSSLHLQGLLSDGGVHSHINHLKAIIAMAASRKVKNVIVHCFLDGRDTPPSCAEKYIIELEEYMKKTGVGRIGSISGRYYSMDRDKRWDRVKKSYDALTACQAPLYKDSISALSSAYENGETDEFVKPCIIEPASPIKDGDSIIMFNFRPDRAREITRALVDPDFDGFEREKKINDLCYVCMTQYDASMPNVEIAFPPEHITNTLGEYIASIGLKQLRIAETEKYAHVTFFFNGGVEKPNENEERILIPSPKVATYDLKPEMSAYLVTDEVIKQIGSDKFDIIILNFANADMVGHTGIMDAAIKAVEALDKCVKKVVDSILSKNGQILLTADHGNADVMCDDNGNVITAHSLNPVPLVNISAEPSNLKSGGRLCDLAPTLLEMMGLDAPKEMTGKSLLQK